MTPATHSRLAAGAAFFSSHNILRWNAARQSGCGMMLETDDSKMGHIRPVMSYADSVKTIVERGRAVHEWEA